MVAGRRARESRWPYSAAAPARWVLDISIGVFLRLACQNSVGCSGLSSADTPWPARAQPRARPRIDGAVLELDASAAPAVRAASAPVTTASAPAHRHDGIAARERAFGMKRFEQAGGSPAADRAPASAVGRASPAAARRSPGPAHGAPRATPVAQRAIEPRRQIVGLLPLRPEQRIAAGQHARQRLRAVRWPS